MDDPITIRRATDRDRQAIARLAQLDSRPPPNGETLLAIVDGELLAALPLPGGELVANPFKPTEALAELLRVYAAQQPVARVSSSQGRDRRLPMRALRLPRRRAQVVHP